MKEEKEQNELLGIIAEKVSEEGCTWSSVKVVKRYCPASEECIWQLMKMYDAQSVNTCVKLAGFVN